MLESPSVAAGVDESPAVPIHDAPAAGVRKVAGTTGADPALVEEVLLLPPVHRPVGVRRGGEGEAAAERG
jgi:hypothetical protein